MSLINVPSSSFYPSKLRFFPWLVVKTEINSDCSLVFRTNGSAISDINNVNVIIESHDHICTTSRFTILHFLGSLKLSKGPTYVIMISNGGPFMYCLLDIMRKVRLHDYVVVQMLFQIFSALVATMAVVYGKNLDLRPFVFRKFWLFLLRLYNVKYNRNPILICLSHQPHMSVGSKRFNNAKLFICCF